MKRCGSAAWSGDLKSGKGQISTESGLLDATPYRFRTRFKNQKATNPEELIGAAHASCFSMALADELGKAGITPERIETMSEVTLDKECDGFAINDVRLIVRVTAPGADRAAVKRAAEEARYGCPISALFSADIKMDTTYEVQVESGLSFLHPCNALEGEIAVPDLAFDLRYLPELHVVVVLADDARPAWYEEDAADRAVVDVLGDLRYEVHGLRDQLVTVKEEQIC